MDDAPARAPFSALIPRISRATLDSLMAAVEVDFVKLTECLVSPGWRLIMPASEMPSIHYNLQGTGLLAVEGEAAVALSPHTLVIIPPERRFVIEAPDGARVAPRSVTVERAKIFSLDTPRRCTAGEEAPQIILVCGYFRAMYGASINLFSSLISVIVEQFDASDHLDWQLKSALAELVVQEVGVGAMTGSLLKQVLVTLLRRSLSSSSLWVERFPMLSDPQIARAFAEMVSRPCRSHTVQSLAQTAGLSRSAFMARFTALFGTSPIVALRELRMRQAANLLNTNLLSIDQIAHQVGYASRSGFLRAFRKVYGESPLDPPLEALQAME